jgi:hypothetical protein
MNTILVFVLAMAASGSAWAQAIPAPAVAASHSIANMRGIPLFTGVKDYQIGDEWGKKEVTADVLSHETAQFKRMATATANYGGGGTAFYLGKFNGHHLMATNYHVLDAYGCNASARFPLLNKTFYCEKEYGRWSAVDLGLFSIRVSAADEAALDKVGQNFNFNAVITQGEEITTIGVGIAGNPHRVMMAGQDSDCKVFSGTEEYRFMGDPDQFNPADYQAWSFASGCDVSHGDSGSAYMDRKSGDIIGIIWTGAIPKPERAQSSQSLDSMLRSNDPAIWTDLSYAVPAPKMREVLRKYIDESNLDADAAQTLEEVIH